ncbi:MAG: biotin/lipoyl-containing protein [Fervidicoccaceae archaeon]
MSEYKVRVNGKEYIVRILGEKEGKIEVEVEGTRLSVSVEAFTQSRAEKNETIRREAPSASQLTPPVQTPEVSAQAAVPKTPSPITTVPSSQPAPPVGGVVLNRVPGKVKEIKVAEGQRVEAGQTVVVIESMKMDIEIRSNRSGIVKAIYVKPGQFAQKEAPLLLVE